MLHMTILLEDTVIVATYQDVPAEEGIVLRWDVQVQDCVSGNYKRVLWTSDELATILALAMGVGEDKTPGFEIDKLYAVAEPLIKGWERNLRPIP